MADLTAIRTALANQIALHTGLRTEAQPRDQVSPPVAIVLPREPLVVFGDTMDGAFTLNLSVVLILSDSAPVDKTQRAMDVLLGLGSGEGQSIAAAINADPTLGSLVHWAIPINVTRYGRIEYNGVTYFGSAVAVQAGCILAFLEYTAVNFSVNHGKESFVKILNTLHWVRACQC